MIDGIVDAAAATRRLDQWLWFARFAKSRSLAARLCAVGAVAVNGVPVGKANRSVRVDDVVAVPQGKYRYTVRVVSLGVRRGPAVEARALYESTEAARPITAASDPAWTPLLGDADL